MENNIMKYKGYSGSIEWSAEDNLFYGKILGIRGLYLYEGKNIAELKKDFHIFVDEYLDDCKEKGIQPETPYKGNFNIRVNENLRDKAISQAMIEGISLNKLVVKALEEYLM